MTRTYSDALFRHGGIFLANSRTLGREICCENDTLLASRSKDLDVKFYSFGTWPIEAEMTHQYVP